jgi:dTDP-4-dehydrorhamnose 3,5-epimerase
MSVSRRLGAGDNRAAVGLRRLPRRAHGARRIVHRRTSSVIFEELAVAGAFLIKPERRSDDRGYFARMWCQQELGAKGLVNHIDQINTGFSPKAGTLRGMHYQLPPHAEVKIARCIRGAVFDVVVDLRQGSPSHGRWAGARLSPHDGTLLYVPQGRAHGYLTLEDDTELVYMTSAPYAPSAARGVRHDDAAFGIDWPAAVRVISEADRNWPAFGPADAVVLHGASS